MTHPRRHWFVFSLRTLFVGVTLLAIPLGAWSGYHLNWIRERRAFLQGNGISPAFFRESNYPAPAMLGLFGEGGCERLSTSRMEEGFIKGDLDEFRRLYPETKIDFFD